MNASRTASWSAARGCHRTSVAFEAARGKRADLPKTRRAWKASDPCLIVPGVQPEPNWCMINLEFNNRRDDQSNHLSFYFCTLLVKFKKVRGTESSRAFTHNVICLLPFRVDQYDSRKGSAVRHQLHLATRASYHIQTLKKAKKGFIFLYFIQFYLRTLQNA